MLVEVRILQYFRHFNNIAMETLPFQQFKNPARLWSWDAYQQAIPKLTQERCTIISKIQGKIHQNTIEGSQHCRLIALMAIFFGELSWIGTDTLQHPMASRHRPRHRRSLGVDTSPRLERRGHAHRNLAFRFPGHATCIKSWTSISPSQWPQFYPHKMVIFSIQKKQGRICQKLEVNNYNICTDMRRSNYALDSSRIFPSYWKSVSPALSIKRSKPMKHWKNTWPGTQGQPVQNGWMEMVISNHFLCKDLVHHPIDSQPFINGWPWGSRYIWYKPYTPGSHRLGAFGG